MKTKNTNLARFHVLLAKSGLKHEKESLLSGYGVASSRDLTIEQLNELCDYLNGVIEKKEKASPAVRRKRSTVLLLLEQLGVYVASNPDRWIRVNDYLKQPRIAGKVMYEMTEEELSALAVKLRLIKKKRAEAELDRAYQAANN